MPITPEINYSRDHFMAFFVTVITVDELVIVWILKVKERYPYTAISLAVSLHSLM